jgi:hypothetical protein
VEGPCLSPAGWRCRPGRRALRAGVW